jgi:hypothetical protein
LSGKGKGIASEGGCANVDPGTGTGDTVLNGRPGQADAGGGIAPTERGDVAVGIIPDDRRSGIDPDIEAIEAGEARPGSGAGGTVPDAAACGVDLYLLAGIKTWPSYFREPAVKLKRLLIEAGYADAETHVLYPYGDHTIPILRQVRQVTRDVMRRLAIAADDPLRPDIGMRNANFPQSPDMATPAANGENPEPLIPLPVETERLAGPDGAIRGRAAGRAAGAIRPPRARSAAAERLERLVETIRERSAGRIVVLVGHSGGGVAACHAGRRLLAEGVVRDLRIIQIGSPKVRIHPNLRDRTAYFYAVDERGRLRDPITRLGTWGGIRRAAIGLPVWDSRRWAPGHIAPVAIEGGHRDYFLHLPGAPGQTANLERIAAVILDWLIRSLHPRMAPPVDRSARPGTRG